MIICVDDKNACASFINKTLAPTTTEMAIASTVVLLREQTDTAIVIVSSIVAVILIDDR